MSGGGDARPLSTSYAIERIEIRTQQFTVCRCQRDWIYSSVSLADVCAFKSPVVSRLLYYPPTVQKRVQILLFILFNLFICNIISLRLQCDAIKPKPKPLVPTRRTIALWFSFFPFYINLILRLKKEERRNRRWTIWRKETACQGRVRVVSLRSPPPPTPPPPPSLFIIPRSTSAAASSRSW